MLVFHAVRDPLYFGWRHSVWEWTKSVLFVFNFFPGSEQGIVWASWTIGVEMVFYTVFPLLFARVRSFPRAESVQVVLRAWSSPGSYPQASK